MAGITPARVRDLEPHRASRVVLVDAPALRQQVNEHQPASTLRQHVVAHAGDGVASAVDYIDVNEVVTVSECEGHRSAIPRVGMDYGIGNEFGGQ
ncbi:MAG: hypothetical protein JWQ95_5153 [Sphaerisporangium sp.]|nr:hypothetical protein [Sphaerisporangium sp.]